MPRPRVRPLAHPRNCPECGEIGKIASSDRAKAGLVRDMRCVNNHQWRTIEAILIGRVPEPKAPRKRTGPTAAEYWAEIRGCNVPDDLLPEWKRLKQKGLSSKQTAEILKLPYTTPTRMAGRDSRRPRV